MSSTGISIRRRWSAAVMAAAGAVVALSAGCGPGGGTASSTKHDETAPAASAATTAETFARLDPATFAGRVAHSGAVLINVHVPYEGEIEHTDAFIPYDHVVGDTHLPKDKNTELLLYCRSGRMSEIAANALHGAGYTHLAHLEGGMRAWEASGRSLIHNPAHGAAAPTTH